MTQQNTLDQTVLASLLEPLEDSEGILICVNEVPFRDEDSTKRLFGAFQFFGIDGLNGGQHYRYASSGVVISHTGPSVNLLIGGDVTEAIPDLMRALDQMGWRNVDVYSPHGQNFFDDLVKHMPASVQLDVSLRDIPTELNVDLRDLARQASAATVANDATDEANFMNMLRSESGIPPSPATASFAEPIMQKETVNPGMGMGVGVGVGVGVSHNFVPDTDPADFAPMIPSPIPAAEEYAANTTLSASSLKSQSPQMRPVISLATASPVAVPHDMSKTKPVVMPANQASIIVSEQKAVVVEPEPTRLIDEQLATTIMQKSKVIVEKQAPCPVPVSAPGVRHNFVSRLVFPIFPEAPITLGDSLVVVCLPERSYSDESLRVLAEDREIVIFEPGAVKVSDRHVRWDIINEQAGVDLVAALWPQAKEDHLAIHALFDCVRDQSSPHSLSDLLALAIQDIDSVILPRLQAVGTDSQVMDYLRMQHRLGLLEVSLWRIVVDLWSVATLEPAQQSVARMSFVALAERRVKPLLVLVRLDALDAGGGGEFLSDGALRWVSRLAISQRVATPPDVTNQHSETEQLAAKLVSGMTPELLSILQRLVKARV